MNKSKYQKWPIGTKRATLRAFDIAINALENKDIYLIPAARPNMARKLKAARKKLLAARLIWL